MEKDLRHYSELNAVRFHFSVLCLATQITNVSRVALQVQYGAFPILNHKAILFPFYSHLSLSFVVLIFCLAYSLRPDSAAGADHATVSRFRGDTPP